MRTPDRKPQPPDPLACCQGNCVPCVFDVYERALERWEKACMDDGAGAGRERSPLAVLRARMADDGE